MGTALTFLLIVAASCLPLEESSDGDGTRRPSRHALPLREHLARSCPCESPGSMRLRGAGGEGKDAGWGAWKALTTPKFHPPRDMTPDEETPFAPSMTPTRGPERTIVSPRSPRAENIPSAAAIWAATRSRSNFASTAEAGDVVVPGEFQTLRQAIQHVGPGRRVLVRVGECELTNQLVVRVRKKDGPGGRSVHISGGWQEGKRHAETSHSESTSQSESKRPQEEHAQEDPDPSPAASVVWGAWLFERGVGGSLHALTLGMVSDEVRQRESGAGVIPNSILLDIQGGAWAMKDLRVCPMRALGIRMQADVNVSMFNCEVRGVPPNQPAADGIVCMGRASVMIEGCKFRYVGIEVFASGEAPPFCGNVSGLHERFDEDDQTDDDAQSSEQVEATTNSEDMRYEMQDPGVIEGSTTGCAVNLFQGSSATIVACQFQNCGIGINIGDSSKAHVVSSNFHDTEAAFRSDTDCHDTALISSNNKVSGNGYSWFNHRRPTTLREHSNQCERESKEREEREAMERELKQLREWHLPADLKEPFAEHYGEMAKELVEAVHWDVSREEAERAIGHNLMEELDAVEARVRGEVKNALPPFKEFNIFMPTPGEPIPGDLGHLEIDPEEEIAKALAAEDEEGESSDGMGPMPTLDGT